MPPRSGIPLLLVLGLLTGCGMTQGTVSSEPEDAVTESIQGRWWTWAASEADDTNPVMDTTGKFCDRNQPEDVWFLAGTFGVTLQRTCMVPAGRPTIVPLVNMTGTEAQCGEFMAAAKGKATLDGKAITSERMQEDNVTVTGVAGNPLTGEAGTFTSYACGIWARIPPLTAGRHKLRIRGSSADFRTGVDYTLIVGIDQEV